MVFGTNTNTMNRSNSVRLLEQGKTCHWQVLLLLLLLPVLISVNGSPLQMVSTSSSTSISNSSSRSRPVVAEKNRTTTTTVVVAGAGQVERETSKLTRNESIASSGGLAESKSKTTAATTIQSQPSIAKGQGQLSKRSAVAPPNKARPAEVRPDAAGSTEKPLCRDTTREGQNCKFAPDQFFSSKSESRSFAEKARARIDNKTDADAGSTTPSSALVALGQTDIVEEPPNNNDSMLAEGIDWRLQERLVPESVKTPDRENATVPKDLEIKRAPMHNEIVVTVPLQDTPLNKSGAAAAAAATVTVVEKPEAPERDLGSKNSVPLPSPPTANWMNPIYPDHKPEYNPSGGSGGVATVVKPGLTHSPPYLESSPNIPSKQRPGECIYNTKDRNSTWCIVLNSKDVKCMRDSDCPGTKKCCFLSCSPFEDVGTCDV